MSFDPKPIGIGNLATNLKRSAKVSAGSLKKVPAEVQPSEDSEIAQLAVDIRETNDKLIIVAPLAGVEPDDVRIEITEDVVIIDGERQLPISEDESSEYLVQECYFGPFSRSIVLPEMVNSKKAKATFKKNVLILEIPKLDNIRTRVIKIRKTE
ncbi:Hsp20/alpha crystallin family protein [Candidatus Gracilibacteria bacterium]|nr:Hsp20/alpha crystallin family protein [Candidatus Gracilibacteria bacterium]